jgi:predicted RNase H-like HicB family nuclease
MKVVKIIIEKSADHYSAFAENVDGVYGAGSTPEDVRQSILGAITLLKKYNKPENIPAVLKADYKLIFRFDTISLLNYCREIFTDATLERITGIDQKRLQHYASGLKSPRATQAKKIEAAFHRLGSELLAVEL